MFSKIFKKSVSYKIPRGYPMYHAIDFEEKLHVTHEQSVLIEKDYLSLVQFDNKNHFGMFVFDADRDLKNLSEAFLGRYKLNKRQAGTVSLFFANITTMRKNQIRWHDMGISTCIWLVSTCGMAENSPNASHVALAGQAFDPFAGLSVDGSYLLPGVALGCTCVAKPVIPGL